MNLSNPNLFRQQCYIGGQWIDADNGNTFPVFNPFDNSQIGSVPECGRDETRRAIEAANAVWPAWRALAAKERSALLQRWAELIDENKEDLATLLTLEQGKPLAESRGEIDYGNGFIKWFAEEAVRLYGDVIPASNAGEHMIVIRQPVGVVAAVTPWNFPTAMITRKCGPALAAGCPIVIKPAEDTPYSALALAVLAEKAGIPAGVFNIVTGIPKEIGGELTENPIVRKLSFTGSTPVGKLLMKQCADTVKKISLELGGNAPFLVFDDANLEAAVEGAIIAKFRNSGQTCVCANRILVQDGVYDKFTKLLAKRMKAFKLGNGLNDGVTQGPLINEAAITKVSDLVTEAVNDGAKAVVGGERASAGPLFFEPTVLTNVQADMNIVQDEIFGPVAPLVKFKSEEEGIAMANNTRYGLASYFFSQDISRVWRVGEALEYGMVGVNVGLISSPSAPFGGVKESGLGREGSKYGIDEYVEMKYLCMK